jgi:hypothetical protein
MLSLLYEGLIALLESDSDIKEEWIKLLIIGKHGSRRECKILHCVLFYNGSSNLDL